MSTNDNGKSVKIGDTEMYYVSFGSGSRTLVVLPGLSDGLATVKGKKAFLSVPYKKYLKDYTVYVFSRKNKMPEGYSIRDMAHDQAVAMKELGIKKAFLMGVSQGGMISQYLAADYPDMIEGLILAVTAPYANDVVKDAVSGWIEMAKNDDHKTLMIDTAEKMYSKAYLDKNRRFFPILAGFTKPKDYTRFFRNAYAILDFDARAVLPKISCPTLILSGDDDKTVGNDAPYEMSRAIPDNTVYIYKGLGHSAFEEGKDFYDRVIGFCQSIS